MELLKNSHNLALKAKGARCRTSAKAALGASTHVCSHSIKALMMVGDVHYHLHKTPEMLDAGVPVKLPTLYFSGATNQHPALSSGWSLNVTLKCWMITWSRRFPTSTTSWCLCASKTSCGAQTVLQRVHLFAHSLLGTPQPASHLAAQWACSHHCLCHSAGSQTAAAWSTHLL